MQLIIGRNPALEAQLIAKSRQPHIVRATPNDARKRFKDAAALENWLAQGRLIHWLVGPNNDLAGIIWYGPKPLPQSEPGLPQTTFAIRLYEGYIGQGRALPFMKQSLHQFVKHQAESGEALTGLWLSTDIDNQAARAAYAAFGYTEITRDDSRITMVLAPAKIQAIRGENG